MLKYGVYRANSKQWDRYAAIQKRQNLLRRKKTSGKVAGDTYSLSKFSSFFILYNSPTRPTEQVGENPGNEVGSRVIHELVSSP